MTIVLSSVPYGLGTTFCKYLEIDSRLPLIFSLYPPEWWSGSSHVGLDHHVTHLRLYRYFPRRDRFQVSRLRRCILLVIHAFASKVCPFSLVDRRLVICYR